MFNFDFYNPTQILFGQGQIAAITALIPPQARVLHDVWRRQHQAERRLR